ncbi:MAG: DUF1599 domain-containing protein [Bacteroidales bacterium]|jgi:hypothetical protein|nr:DUF1599 domain-containing protein [Bacteroidales bacterium]
MKTDTSRQFEQAMSICKEVFLNKMKDYGSSWRILRTPSLTDQIYIKANRIRSIEQKGIQKIDEGVKPEFIGIVNYSVIALIQLELGEYNGLELDKAETEKLYDKHIHGARDLMENKNHDYDEAWRNMRVSSYTDIILMKLMRIKQIEDREGETLVSEGVDANYRDIINYALFALIKIDENTR